MPETCDHEWKFVDESFDHEFGTEVIHFYECALCGAVREPEPGEGDIEGDIDG